MDNKGKITMTAVIILVAIAAVGIWWYYNYQKKGESYIEVGYILADGTYVKLKSGVPQTLYFEPSPLKLYTDETKVKEIVGLRWTLYATPQTSIDVSTASIAWTRRTEVCSGASWDRLSAWSPYSTSSGSITVPVNAESKVDEFTLMVADWTGWTDKVRYVWRTHYDVTASVTHPTEGTLTANIALYADLRCYWEKSTLTITAHIVNLPLTIAA